jgi:hypothetical protein
VGVAMEGSRTFISGDNPVSTNWMQGLKMPSVFSKIVKIRRNRPGLISEKLTLFIKKLILFIKKLV